MAYLVYADPVDILMKVDNLFSKNVNNMLNNTDPEIFPNAKQHETQILIQCCFIKRFIYIEKMDLTFIYIKLFKLVGILAFVFNLLINNFNPLDLNKWPTHRF